jgi:hypothetical protein
VALLDGHRPKSKGGASVPHVADLPHAQTDCVAIAFEKQAERGILRKIFPYFKKLFLFPVGRGFWAYFS